MCVILLTIAFNYFKFFDTLPQCFDMSKDAYTSFHKPNLIPSINCE